MTKISKQGLKENLEALSNFAYSHTDEWYEYCKKFRNGKQDIEELSMLITSITSENPWRFIITKETVEQLAIALSRDIEKINSLLKGLEQKLENNEKLVCGDT